MKNGGESVTRPFWVRWYGDSAFEYHGPWWISGESEDHRIFVAAVMARDEEHAKDIIEDAHDDGCFPAEWSFVEERPPDWDPFASDRFPRADWMQWPWPRSNRDAQRQLDRRRPGTDSALRLHPLRGRVRGGRVMDGILTYERPGLVLAVVAALGDFVGENEWLIWREPFRWKRWSTGEEGAQVPTVIRNAYESYGLKRVCEDNRWSIVHDFGHVAVVRAKGE